MDLSSLRTPVLAAPMAGGPSTPELVAATSAAGGFASLAAGYRTPEQVADQVAAVRALSDAPFAVNIFVPALPDQSAQGAVEAFARALAPVADRVGAQVPAPRWDDTDHYQDKLDLVLELGVPVVSFTFGLPGADVVRRLHAAGVQVMVTVTDADEALAAARRGADMLVAQGAGAGGHRATHRVDAIPNDLSWLELLREVRSVTAMPVVAAGGIADARAVDRALGQGATAVAVGTALLLADEAGTGAAHRAALTDPARDHTVVTRAFSGRPGRGLANEFVRRFDALAPAAFPVVDQLTKPLRAAAAARGEADLLNLWAGTQWRSTRTGPVADILASLIAAD